MRHTLLASALESLAANLRHHERVSVFELGSVYLPSEEGVLPDEVSQLVIAMSGARAERSWRQADTGPMDFYDLKGVVESLLDGLHVQGGAFEASEHPIFYPGRIARVCLARRGHEPQQLGVFGELHPRVREAWDFAAVPVLIAEFDVASLREVAAAHPPVTDVARYPAVNEDLAIIVNEDVAAEKVETVIRRAGGHLLRGARLFDIYRGEQLGAGRKSLAYALTYLADDHTLMDAEVERQRAKIMRALETQLGATIRR